MNRSPQDRQRDVDLALSALREEMQSLAAPPRVEAAALAAFRAGPLKRRAALWVWSAAAAACAALAVFLLWPQRLALSPPAVALRHAPPAPEIRIARRPAPRPAVVASSHPRQPEIATGFFPVRYGVPLDQREFAEIVRVTLPRAVMVRYGLPAWGDLTAPVVADIIVGRDRVAQAIRFVR
jgi:hypothetical protein